MWPLLTTLPPKVLRGLPFLPAFKALLAQEGASASCGNILLSSTPLLRIRLFLSPSSEFTEGLLLRTSEQRLFLQSVNMC